MLALGYLYYQEANKLAFGVSRHTYISVDAAFAKPRRMIHRFLRNESRANHGVGAGVARPQHGLPEYRMEKRERSVGGE